MGLITILMPSAAFCNIVSSLPHAIKTIQTKDTSGITPSMNSLFALGTLLLPGYGLLTDNVPIPFTNEVTFYSQSSF